jgi:ATP-binding cassette subfamily F protein uup
LNLISAENLSKTYSDKPLFEGLNFGLAQGQKAALIGVNGCGKSTLMRILAGVETSDTGRVVYRSGLSIVYLPQDPYFAPGQTVREVVFSGGNEQLDLIAAYESLVERAAHDEAASEELQVVTARIDALGAWSAEAEVHAILTRLEVGNLDRRVDTLSGGQRKRIALAKAFVSNPDVLILDEPTNHLDLDTVEWLEEIMATAKQTLLLVTHDRYFLEKVTNEIIELDQGTLQRYPGSYDAYLEKKADREGQMLAEREKATSLYARELEWLRRSPKARTTKSRSRIQAAETLEEKTKAPQTVGEIQLEVYGRRIGGQVLEIKNLRKAYNDVPLVEHFTYTFNRMDRVGVVGPNGVGKTTFLKLLTGEVTPDVGKIRWGETIVPGYYRQETPVFKPNMRVIEAVTELAETVTLSKKETISASQLLEHFLFARNSHHKMVETLSGGEKRRLHLLRVLMTNPNFLILDEPTNDLDLVTLRQLESFLREYQGCLVVVTHDRYFMDQLVDHLFVFEGNGVIRDFPGNYTDYRESLREKKSSPEPVAPVVTKASPEPPAAPKNRPKKLSFKEQKELENLEAEIAKKEARQTEIAALLSQGGDYQELMQLGAELETIKAAIETMSDRWLELSAIAEGDA